MAVKNQRSKKKYEGSIWERKKVWKKAKLGGGKQKEIRGKKCFKLKD